MAKIILNKKNYFHNLKIISDKVGSVDKVAVVLKDNAYGHGLLEMAQMANEFGIKKAVVRNMEEAKKIEKLFHDILILSETSFHTYSHTFHITINNFQQIKNIPENTRVHLKIDSGMHRNGIHPDELEASIHGIIERNLKFTGVFTHHRSADEITCEYYWQKSNFHHIKMKVKKICEQLSIPLPMFHSCNSSALFRTKNFDEDLARVGIAQYGYLESNEVFDNPDLKPVMSLWCNKIATRNLKKGERVGYGGTFVADKEQTVSTYDLGYGDGFLRINENQEFFTPQGEKLLGRVSMDNISLNSEKQEVCIFEDAKILAKLHDTISYEIITTLSKDIPREIQ